MVLLVLIYELIKTRKEKFNVIKEDSDDNMVLECANEGKVNFIVTQDKHLLKIKEFKGIKILTPEEFLIRD